MTFCLFGQVMEVGMLVIEVLLEKPERLDVFGIKEEHLDITLEEFPYLFQLTSKVFHVSRVDDGLHF